MRQIIKPGKRNWGADFFHRCKLLSYDVTTSRARTVADHAKRSGRPGYPNLRVMSYRMW